MAKNNNEKKNSSSKKTTPEIIGSSNSNSQNQPDTKIGTSKKEETIKTKPKSK